MTHNSGRVEAAAQATADGENDAESATDSRRAFPIREFCRQYGVGRTVTYQEIASGRLRAVKVGRRTLITYDAAEAWLAALPELEPKSLAERRAKQ
jgi:excisionase family DNA binding protein